jgi:predicted aconitase
MDSLHYAAQNLSLNENTMSDVAGAARSDTEAVEVQHSTGVTPESLKGAIMEKLDAVHVDIADLSGTAL